MTTQLTATAPRVRTMSTVSRLLFAAMGALLVVDLVGGLGLAGPEPGMAAYQVFLLAVTGVVGVLAAVRAKEVASS